MATEKLGYVVTVLHGQARISAAEATEADWLRFGATVAQSREDA